MVVNEVFWDLLHTGKTSCSRSINEKPTKPHVGLNWGFILAIPQYNINTTDPVHTVEHNEDLLPLCVPHFRRLAEQDLPFVTDEDAVEDELADRDVSQVSQAAVFAHS